LRRLADIDDVASAVEFFLGQAGLRFPFGGSVLAIAGKGGIAHG
jgi:hypothetical protein